MLQRRIVRYCECGCGEKLARKERESMAHYVKRKFMDRHHAAKRKHVSNPANICFCGRPRANESPYCCWEHRLIAVKCKSWGIELAVEIYESHSNKLKLEQKYHDDRCRPNYASA